MSAQPLVTRTDQDGVAILSLNRPESLNALSPNLFVELREHITSIAHNTAEVGCVILRGEGRSFSAGNDLNAIQAGERAPSRHFQAETLDCIEQMPQVVIASVQGHCYTGSLELVLACDLLIASESAKFSDTHGKWAMTPTWGMTQRLPGRVGLLRAKEIMFTGRVVSGQEAVRLGLANECVEDDNLRSRTLELAMQIVTNSWHTLRADKSLINSGLDLSLTDGLKYERQNSPGPGPDMAERLAGFGNK
jgi:enoyl-CoA hydratase/carnithine racemase